jgi:hypothetical protein
MANIKTLGNGWILVNNEQLAHNSAKTFLCGYVSCKLPSSNFFENIKGGLKTIKHPDQIPLMRYNHDNNPYHAGSLFNEALVSENPELIDKDF